MLELTIILLLTIGVAVYVISLISLYLESERSGASIINLVSVVVLVIGLLMACNNVQEVECTKCESKKVVSTSVKYCDVCGGELIPVNEK